MGNDMKCSVLGLGAAFVSPQVANSYGFPRAGMESTLFPPRLKRRMSHVTRLALAAAERACQDAEIDVAAVPTIFTSVISEIKVTDTLCRNISAREFPLSPTLFHNSVHNTAAGYWGMVTKNQHPAQAMAAGANTLVMGLLESYTQLQMSSSPVLLVCYEEDVPQPLFTGEQVSDCAIAMVLDKAGSNKIGVHFYQQYDKSLKNIPLRSDTDANWSVVQKAINLAIAIQKKKYNSKVLISSSSEAWYAEVTSGE